MKPNTIHGTEEGAKARLGWSSLIVIIMLLVFPLLILDPIISVAVCERYFGTLVSHKSHTALMAPIIIVQGRVCIHVLNGYDENVGRAYFPIHLVIDFTAVQLGLQIYTYAYTVIG